MDGREVIVVSDGDDDGREVIVVSDGDDDGLNTTADNKRQCVRREPVGLCRAAQDGSAEMSDLFLASMLRCPATTCRTPFIRDGLGKAMQCTRCRTKFCVEHMAIYDYMQYHFCGITVHGDPALCYVSGCDHLSICRATFTPEEKMAFDYRVHQVPVDTYNMALFRDLVGARGTVANVNFLGSPIYEPALLDKIQEFV
jgi:hypothetical protein